MKNITEEKVKEAMTTILEWAKQNNVDYFSYCWVKAYENIIMLTYTQNDSKKEFKDITIKKEN